MDEDSPDHVASDLICSVADVDDPETVGLITDYKDRQSSAGKASSFGDCGSDSMIALPSLSDDKFALMVQEEKNYMSKDDYLERLRTGDLDMSVRRQALDWILKAHAHCGFGELVFYLAMNYLDRFLSFFELPGGKAWAVQLLAVACLSLGAKMVEVEVPLVVDLQVGDPKYVFEAKTIRRMELLVLSNLNWRMNSCTPYSFIDYFLRKIISNGDHADDDDQQPKSPPDEALIGKAVKLILCTIKGIDFLEFKPSEIAAAVAILVAGETKTTGAVDINKALPCFNQVEKEKVIKCHKLLQDLRLMTKVAGSGSNSNGSVVPQSPIGVLEAASYLSYKSDERTTVGSCPNSSNNGPDPKKKKIDTTQTSSSPTSFANNSQKS